MNLNKVLITTPSEEARETAEELRRDWDGTEDLLAQLIQHVSDVAKEIIKCSPHVRDGKVVYDSDPFAVARQLILPEPKPDRLAEALELTQVHFSSEENAAALRKYLALHGGKIIFEEDS